MAQNEGMVRDMAKDGGKRKSAHTIQGGSIGRSLTGRFVLGYVSNDSGPSDDCLESEPGMLTYLLGFRVS